MFGASIGRAAQRIIDAIVRWLASGHINPNVLTVIGVGINVGCGLLFGFGLFFEAGIALVVANLFDMLDGQVARLSGRVTRFGGFLDSSLDRLSDMVVFVGLMVFYARDLPAHSTLNVFLAGAGLMGSVMVSYASARAESLIPKCDVGFLRRQNALYSLLSARSALIRVRIISLPIGCRRSCGCLQLDRIGPSRTACIIRGANWRRLSQQKQRTCRLRKYVYRIRYRSLSQRFRKNRDNADCSFEVET